MVFSRAEGQASAEIQLGRTRVLAVATGEVSTIASQTLEKGGIVTGGYYFHGPRRWKGQTMLSDCDVQVGRCDYPAAPLVAHD